MLGSQAANQLNKAVLHTSRAALLVLFLPFSLADAQVPIPPTALAPQQPDSNGKPAAQPTQQSAVPANEELTTLRNGITQSQLTEEEKAALLATVARTQSALASAAEFDRSAQDFKALLDSLPQRTEQAKQKLADPEEPQAGLQVEDTLEALEAILPQLTSQLATAKSDLARIESAAAVSIKRRQEIEVMKLVGATNWFIRIPFMVEGTIHGLIGAALAIPALFVVDNKVLAFFQESDAVPLFRGFAVPDGFVWDTSIWLLLIGGAVGMIGSAIAVTRYLDV